MAVIIMGHVEYADTNGMFLVRNNQMESFVINY